MKKLILLFALLLFISQSIYSQIDDRINQFGQKNIESFVKPLGTTLGTALNTGTYYTADYPTLFGFSIGFRGMLVLIPSSEKTFIPVLPRGYTASSPSATIYGAKDGGAAYGGANGYVTYPGGLGVSNIPVIFPQITGSLLGTEVLIRFVPDIKIKNQTLSFFGIGLSHSISRYIPLLPIDIAVQILYSKISLSGLFDVKDYAVNAHVSKTLGIFTAYGGVQYENTNVNISYTLKGDPNSGDPALRQDRTISASFTGDNHVRLTLGGALKLGFFLINADYSLITQPVISGGFSFVF